MMMRLILMLVCSLAVAGCNLSDPIDGPPGAVNNENNDNNDNNDNNANNGTDMDPDNDAPGGDLSVTFSEVRINAEEVPTQAAAQTDLLFEADAIVTGASGNVQLVIYIDDAEPACLYDGPTEGEIDVEGTIAGSDEVETKELIFEAFELADCTAALAASTGDGEVIGEVEFLEPPPLMVVAVTPADGEEDVVVDGMIRISFNTALDAGSVTGRVTLSNAMGQVPATVNVMGADIILTPSNSLAEFQTLYTVDVSDGITGGGRTLEDAFTSSFRTRMFSPDVRYVATNEFHTVSFQLGIDAANQCRMVPADNTAPAQRFRFVPRDDGWIGYSDASIAGGRALDAGDGNMANCAMRPLNAMPLASQIWSFVPNPSGMRAFTMQSALQGDIVSLDSTMESPSVGAFPLMQPTADIDRQRWTWRRAD